MSASSPAVPDFTFETDETVLWFLAVDPEGKHETGPAEKWTNTLTITHDPKEVMGKRTVTLTVKPRGEIRFAARDDGGEHGRSGAECQFLPAVPHRLRRADENNLGL